MKLLKVTARNFKNCADNVTIDFVAKSRKTSEDKEYELQEIAEDLYVYTTAAFAGKNASGKTTAIQLLDCCYSILGEFCLENKTYSYNNINLDMYFYHEGYIYRYRALMAQGNTVTNKAVFVNQELFKKKYMKTKLKEIYLDKGFELQDNLGELPEDTSIVFFVLRNKATRAMYYTCDGEGRDTYGHLFMVLKKYGIDDTILERILKLFDENIHRLTMIDEHNYELELKSGTCRISDAELVHRLSSGTTKGILLYIIMVASLKNGFDLIIDEIENHFHKTLVENMISLYKDKAVNRHNATLIFTTHYCELLDTFNRQDNIWITRADDRIYFDNLYEEYNIRHELLKSRQFYSNTFGTAVSYNRLMDLKKELIK